MDEPERIAGVAVLDLVNTVTWRGNPDRGEDTLGSVEECVSWAVRAGVVTTEEARELGRPADLVAELTSFRQVVERVLSHPDEPIVPAARRAIRDAYAHADLAGTGGRRHWVVATVDRHLIRRRLALQLEWLLTADPGRVGECGDEECRWVFLDTSRAHNRRWCRSSDCGNRHRVREHHRRQVAAAGG